MKKIIILIVVLLAAFAIYRFTMGDKKTANTDIKQGPLSLKKHSDLFNNSINSVMASYLNIRNAFVEADTSLAKKYAAEFINRLDSIPVDELKKDTAMIFESASSAIADIKANAQSLLLQSTILEMRKDFSMVTEMLYPAFFKTINYEGSNLYLQHCPMAFADEIGANWISDKIEIVNPYLGKNHPKYKGTMLHCGEVMDTIKPLN